MITANWPALMAARATHFGVGIVATRCLTILIFHRVLERPDPLFPSEMHAQRFDRLLGLIAKTCTVTTLRKGATLLREKALPARALTITFDDGYADNAEVALPLLRKHGLVATFFVSTGFLDGGMMWNDAVIESVRATTKYKVDLSDFGLGERPLRTLAERRACIGEVLRRFKHMQPALRDHAVAAFGQALGTPAPVTGQMMKSEQVRELSRFGMEIGAHTVNHPILLAINADDAEREIRQGRDQLQVLIDAPVESLAYPNGKPGHDFDMRHVDMARRIGFTAAVSTAPGVARPGDDLLQLPRFTPWDASDLRWIVRLAAQPLRRSRQQAR